MPRNPEELRSSLVKRVLTSTAYFLNIIGIAATLYQTPSYWTQPYHTSALSGQSWVNELIHGHLEQYTMSLECISMCS